jgi:hypothetical protein
MATEAARTNGMRVRTESVSLLIEYTLKSMLIAGLSELVLYRLVSRLGMHLSKVAQEYPVVDYFLRGASQIGFALMNFSALLLFVVLFTLLFSKGRGEHPQPLDRVVVPLVSLLLALTLTFLIFPPAMLGSIAYSVVTLLVIWILGAQYWMRHPSLKPRAMIACYVLGVSAWLYYQTATIAYGWLGLASSPPLVLDIHRYGEALMVLATALVFAVYSGFSLRTRNRRQRHRAIFYAATWALLFIGLLVMDGVLEVFNPAAAQSVRNGARGIGWIFQMGMGYTFYLPFALYMAGLLFWGYAVMKQVSMGRRAGYGLAFMFIAGYALQLSHQTLFVVVGLLLIVNDARVEARDSAARDLPVPFADRPTAQASGA